MVSRSIWPCIPSRVCTHTHVHTFLFVHIFTRHCFGSKKGIQPKNTVSIKLSNLCQQKKIDAPMIPKIYQSTVTFSSLKLFKACILDKIVTLLPQNTFWWKLLSNWIKMKYLLKVYIWDLNPSVFYCCCK